MKVVVIIVTYNGEKWIKKCLDNIIESNVELTTIVVDNFSQDGTLEIVKRCYPQIEVIQNYKNLGFGKANNIGLKYAIDQNADYTFLCNQDVYVEYNTIQKLISTHKKNPEFGIISPLHFNGDGSSLDKNFFSDSIPNKFREELNELFLKKNIPVETNFVNAAAWLLSKECIANVGGFDPLFPHYGEDRDYCYRANYHGYKTGITFNSLIYHDRKYDKNNNFRKLKHLHFASGLAHIKNVNNSLILNYIVWIKSSIIRIIKSFIRFNIYNISVEIYVLKKLFIFSKEINLSRNRSKFCVNLYL